MRNFLIMTYFVLMILACLGCAGYVLSRGDHSADATLVTLLLLVVAGLLTRLMMIASTLSNNA